MNIRRVSFLMGAQALVLSMLFLTAPPAQAAFSDLPDDTWMTNGEVKAMVRAGGHIYIAGKFTQVRSAPPGTPGSQYGSIG
ncbi:MAG TPA: hypothetical protein VJ868_00445, partial [Actinomycetota bacterium]|nr:hypothetical protein [Actinomycetota bacterium]